MEKRYQVFVSSTFTDLIEERQVVLKSILMLDHMPAGMELFPATDDTAWQLIKDVINASDYYVLIIGGRYGSLDEQGISFTEKEYIYASSKGIPVVAFLHENPDNLPRGKTEQNSKAWKKLKEFRKVVEAKHTCTYWDTPQELESKVVLGLIATVKRSPQQGWVRAGKVASAEANQQIVELQNQLADYRDKLDQLSLSAPVGSENLCQDDDTLELGFKVTYSEENRDYRKPPKENFREKFYAVLSWNQLFGAVAPHLTEPLTDTKFRSHVAKFLREDYDDTVYNKHAGFRPTASTISENLFQTIRVQFVALGLIQTFSKSVIKKDGSEVELRFCELTDYGMAQLFKTRALYREN